MMATNTLKSKDANKDGELDAKEFWDVTEESPMDAEEWKEHQADFEKVDTDKSGKLDIKELLEWEGGTFHTKHAMDELFKIADDDKDGHLTADEIGAHAPDLADSEATMHFSEWAEHHEL
jgi:Ca2+-binding EF-hand superfamily protein